MGNLFLMNVLACVDFFFLRFVFDVWKQNARERKEKRQKKLIAETHLNQTLVSKVRQTGITRTTKRTN